VLLDTFGFSQPLIDEIRDFLNDSSVHLDGSTPAGVGEAFDSSPASIGCAGDAGKAQEKVALAITDMVTGLQGYVDALTGMAARARDIEDVTEADLRTKWRQAEACQTPDIASAGVCVPPTGQGQGDG
jgi:hypothetical protein